MRRQRQFQLDVLWQGPGYAVVAKPSGLLVASGRGGKGVEPTVIDLLSARLVGERVSVVHRLDRGTSGCLVVATQPEAHRALSMQFEHREVKKTYLALVDGVPPESEGCVDVALEPSPKGGSRMRVATGNRTQAKPSVTHWRLLVAFRRYALLEVKPVTGRQHQIRVHLQHMGYPLAIDHLYGQRTELGLSAIKRNYKRSTKRKETPLMERATLHAWKIAFTCPSTGATVRVRAPLPADYRRLVSLLLKFGH